MPQAGYWGKRGVPDFICCHKGMFLAIETKAKGNKVKPAQESQLKKIQEAKGVALVIDENNYQELHHVFA